MAKKKCAKQNYTRKEAMAAARRFNRVRMPDHVHHYHCHACKCWHIGH